MGAALERHLDRRWSCRPTLPFCAATAPLFERFWRYLGQHPDAECSRLLDDPTESLASKLAPLTQQEAHTAMRGFSDATSSVALDLSCTCASCGTRVPGTASTITVGDDDSPEAELFRHETACRTGWRRVEDRMTFVREDGEGAGSDGVDGEAEAGPGASSPPRNQTTECCAGDVNSSTTGMDVSSTGTSPGAAVVLSSGGAETRAHRAFRRRVDRKAASVVVVTGGLKRSRARGPCVGPCCPPVSAVGLDESVAAFDEPAVASGSSSVSRKRSKGRSSQRPDADNRVRRLLIDDEAGDDDSHASDDCDHGSSDDHADTEHGYRSDDGFVELNEAPVNGPRPARRRYRRLKRTRRAKRVRLSEDDRLAIAEAHQTTSLSTARRTAAAVAAAGDSSPCDDPPVESDMDDFIVADGTSDGDRESDADTGCGAVVNDKNSSPSADSTHAGRLTTDGIGGTAVVTPLDDYQWRCRSLDSLSMVQHKLHYYKRRRNAARESATGTLPDGVYRFHSRHSQSRFHVLVRRRDVSKHVFNFVGPTARPEHRDAFAQFVLVFFKPWHGEGGPRSLLERRRHQEEGGAVEDAEGILHRSWMDALDNWTLEERQASDPLWYRRDDGVLTHPYLDNMLKMFQGEDRAREMSAKLKSMTHAERMDLRENRNDASDDENGAVQDGDKDGAVRGRRQGAAERVRCAGDSC